MLKSSVKGSLRDTVKIQKKYGKKPDGRKMIMAYYFFADPHFGDDSIRRYENRPFADTGEMDRTIIDNWNSIVSAEDTVFLVGDIGDERNIAGLSGRKILIRGNHDNLSCEEYRKAGFLEVYDYPIVFKDFWIISHEPMYVNRNAPYANIFGHVHSNPQYLSVSARSFCVSAERIGFKPVRFEEIAEKVAEADRMENK